MIDYALWEVIEKGATLRKTKVMEGVTIEMPITTVKEKAQRRLEVKARSTLMMGIPNEHQLKFNSIKDAKKLQKLMSQLELLEEKLSQVDVNQNLLRSLSPEWNTHVVVWRNKADLDTMSIDDLYNNLKLYEPEVKVMSSLSSSTLNMAFMSSSNNNTSSTNAAVNNAQAVNTTHGVSNASTQVNAAYSTNIDNLTLVSCDGLGGYDWSDQADEGSNYALMAFASLSSDSEIIDNCKKWLGYENYNAVLPPYIGKFMPPTHDLSFTGLDEFANEPVVENSKAKSSEEEPKVVKKNDDTLIIEEWVSDDEEHDVSQPKIEKKTVKPSIVKIEFSTAMAKTINGKVQLRAQVYGKEIVITESSVRRDLQLADKEGIDCLPNSTIFELALIGNPKRNVTQVPQPSGPTESITDEAVHKKLGDRLVRAATTTSILEAEQDSGNITKTQFKATPNKPSSVLDLEKITTTQHNEIDSSKRRVKKLERRNKSRTHRLKRLYKVDVLDGEEMFVAKQHENVVEEVVDAAQVSTAATTVTITTEEITLAQALKALKT
uniref:Uncharacterized protein n=1 Tax=Tanacetum cinerariifolium TaxID=118510 RepID=A0A6L2ME72_TANCI|nr:hypothetical protein [Tanacetum cinerariifolium]